MISESKFVEALRTLNLGPISIEIESSNFDQNSLQRADAFIILKWGDQEIPFKVEFKRSQSMRDMRNAVDQTLRWRKSSKWETLIVVPYLNEKALEYLEQASVNGIDLCGNGRIEVQDKMRFFQKGFVNRYPRNRRSKTPYTGKSALVGMVFLIRPQYGSVGEVQDEITKRGARLSMSQVSKVLTALEDDLVIAKERDKIRLLQPEKLLELLSDGYVKPRVQATLRASVQLNQTFFAKLLERSRNSGAKIAAFDPQRYVIAPEAQDNLLIYTSASYSTDLSQMLDLESASRFENVTIQAINEPSVFLDTIEADGFLWCSPLQVYFHLMKGGKREKQIAKELKSDVLAGIANNQS